MAIKTYQIADDGDAYDVSFYIDGHQVAGACVPLDMGIDAAFDLAKSLGESFQSAPGGYPRAPIANQQEKR